MKWFKHYGSASHSVAVNKIIDEFGLEGYARWFLLLELMTEKMEDESCKFEFHFREISAKVQIKFSKKLGTFLQKLHDFSLIKLEIQEKVYKIECPILLDLMSRDFKKARTNRAETAPKNKIKNKEKEEDKEYTSKPKTSRLKLDSYDEKNKPTSSFVVNLWNETCVGSGKIKPAQMLSNLDLRNFLELRRHLPFEKNWKAYFENFALSDTLNGTGDLNFCASISWALKPDNASKVLNGQYQNVENSKSKKPSARDVQTKLLNMKNPYEGGAA